MGKPASEDTGSGAAGNRQRPPFRSGFVAYAAPKSVKIAHFAASWAKNPEITGYFRRECGDLIDNPPQNT
jgi:hypothetical protein